MSILNIDEIKDFIDMCQDGFDIGWHERNGGNLTYRLKPDSVKQAIPFLNEDNSWVKMDVQSDVLANEYFITTGSGKFFRNVKRQPEKNIGIVKINENGDSYKVVWGLIDAVPTSEFPTHFMNHSVRYKATNGDARVIYHAHPDNLIAMTYITPLTAKDFSRILWKSATECAVVFPAGVGVVPWMVPGGVDIAVATSTIMQDFEAAVWAHHGLFCSGNDFDTTFGLMHTIEKAAKIYLTAMSASGGKISQTISDEQILAIGKDFGVTINKDFLED